MPENYEKWGVYILAIVQIIAVVWWMASLSASVERQDIILNSLAPKVDSLSTQIVRIEERTQTLKSQLENLQQDSKTTKASLRRIEDGLLKFNTEKSYGN